MHALPLGLWRSAYGVVVDGHVLLVFGAGDGLVQALDDRAVAGVLHVVLRLGQQQLPGGGVQVLLAAVLSHTRPGEHGGTVVCSRTYSGHVDGASITGLTLRLDCGNEYVFKSGGGQMNK